MARREGGYESAESLAGDRPKAKRPGALAGMWPFLRPYRGLMIASILALLLAAITTLVLPVAMRRVVDLGFAADQQERVNQYFIALLGLALLLGFATALRLHLVTKLGERVIADLRRRVYDHVIGMSPAFYERINTAETLSRLTTDTSVIQSVIGSSIAVALRNMLLLSGGLLMMLITSVKLTGAALLIVPLVVLPILLMGRKVRALSRESQDRIADAAVVASETLQAASVVQAFTAEAAARERFTRAAEDAYDAARRRIGMRARLTALVIILIFSAVVGVLWLGARDVMSGRMTPGELVQFMVYSVLVAGSVGALAEVWTEVLRAAGATERLMELLNTPNPIALPQNPRLPTQPARGEIRFDAVDFAYPARPNTLALRRFSLHIRPGETVALVGPSGAGKTTVFQLLLRFYDPQSGQISLDGVPLPQMDPQVFRRLLALVPQEPMIFADTVLANIRFGKPGATEAEVERAARAAAAWEFISALPQGLNTYVGERGIMLSGGQKQRIAIARAILRDAPVLLLDEATSALDAESELAVQHAVDQLSATRTTLVIAHRLATVKKADRIIVMDEGSIVAEGTHDQLVAEDGLYARLARLQFTEG